MGWDYGCKCRHYEVLPIHRFGHQSGRGEIFGGLSTAKFHVVPVRVFLTCPKKPIYMILLNFFRRLGWDGAGDGVGAGDGGVLICTNPH